MRWILCTPVFSLWESSKPQLKQTDPKQRVNISLDKGNKDHNTIAKIVRTWRVWAGYLRKRKHREVPNTYIKLSWDKESWATPELNTLRMRLQDAQQRMATERLETLGVQTQTKRWISKLSVEMVEGYTQEVRT